MPPLQPSVREHLFESERGENHGLNRSAPMQEGIDARSIDSVPLRPCALAARLGNFSLEQSQHGALIEQSLVA